jgi:hypothetical protein
VYSFSVCGEERAPAPVWESGVHTHGDGVIHIHPFSSAEEGRGARLVKWFEYGGGVLTEDEIRLPGTTRTWQNGDECPAGTPFEGEPGVVSVSVNGEQLSDWSGYIPQDGDSVRIVFGPEE